MAVTASRTVEITYSGGVTGTEPLVAADNLVSPGQVEIRTLSAGANSITVPTAGATTVACTVVPPANNSTAITLKGVTGDTGIHLHNTDPTSIALDPTVTTFVLTAAGTITGVRLFWT